MGSEVKILAAALAAAALLVTGAMAATPKPPQITESLTPLPCPPKPKTTLQLKACAGQRILKSDAEINKRIQAIWFLLKATGPRTRFATGERSWLAYRRAVCRSRADVFKGGSLASLQILECTADLNRTHSRELALFQADLLKHR